MRLFLLILFGISDGIASPLNPSAAPELSREPSATRPASRRRTRSLDCPAPSPAIRRRPDPEPMAPSSSAAFLPIPTGSASCWPDSGPYNTEVTIRTGVPIQLPIRLEVAAGQTTVTVEGASATLVDNKTTASDTIDRGLLAVLPTLSPDSGLNDAIILTTPGVAADSNGFFHPLGDHAQVSYVIDGQPVSDQRNKVFSTSIPANAIQSMEVISGSPAAEYGDKTSLVINATTRSGLGQKPTGSFARQLRFLRHHRGGSHARLGQRALGQLSGLQCGTYRPLSRYARVLADARQGQHRNAVRPHGLSARREGCPAPEPDGGAQLDAGSQHLRSGAAGPKAEGGVVQHRARLPAHHRRADSGHRQRVSPPRPGRLLSQPRSAATILPPPSRRTAR